VLNIRSSGEFVAAGLSGWGAERVLDWRTQGELRRLLEVLNPDYIKAPSNLLADLGIPE
jgi:hypothetical protein